MLQQIALLFMTLIISLSKLCEKYGTDKGYVKFEKKPLMDGGHIHIVFIITLYFLIVERM